MNGSDIKRWRTAQRIKQSALAELLGVSQATVSKWESGAWQPCAAMARRIKDTIYAPHEGRLIIELACLAPQQQMKVLTRGTGFQLAGVSAGFDAYWPEMRGLLGANTRDMLMGEAADYIETTDYIAQALAGEVFMLTGVSHRLLRFGAPQAKDARIRWHAIARHIDGEMIHEVIFEPATPNAATGIEYVLRRAEVDVGFN
jgi:DNA-binding XRE family transcriptional regulator